MFLRTSWPYLTAFVLCVAVMLLLFVPLTSNQPYPYDGADYIYAGTRGFWKNYIDAGSLPLWDFIQKGLELRDDPSKRAEISGLARSQDDISMYRHFHGPLYAYWVAFWSKLGVTDNEAMFRSTGLIAHTATSLVLMLAYWSLFPAWPRVGGLVAGALFLFNRTGLITASEVTQHLLFVLTAAITLWMLGLFCKTFETRYWYAMMASLALALATLESAFLIGLTIAVVLLLLYRPIRERWPDFRQQLLLLVKGIGVFLLVLFVVWPAGIFKLSALRGFLFLAYMSLERKTFFAAIGPWTVWVQKFESSPWEIALGAVAFVLGWLLWRKFEYRRETLPWLVYALVFILVTLKVTIDYTHYRGTIALAWTMTVAIVFGYIWKHSGAAIRAALVVAVSVPLVAGTISFYQERKFLSRQTAASAGVLSYLRERKIPDGSKLYVPYFFVPMIHLYRPDVETVGYDRDWPVHRLITEVMSPSTYDEIVCPRQVCNTLETALGGAERTRQLISPEFGGEPLFAFRAKRR